MVTTGAGSLLVIPISAILVETLFIKIELLLYPVVFENCIRL